MNTSIANNLSFTAMNKWGNKHLLLGLLRIAGMALLIGDLLFLYFLPLPILYADDQAIGMLTLIAAIALVPILVYGILRLFNREAITMAVLSLFFVIPTFDYFQDYRKEQALKTEGLQTKAVITDRKLEEEKNDKGKWLIKCTFKVADQNYETLYHDEEEHHYKVGDSLNITYLKYLPKVYTLAKP
ncbi:hypothetical protein PBAL39_16601 [Pedobacter sp. BAL39]|uniref:hypothetical protein n=1 Tax=Pedobacter sp. BAL39 TaxID=391596 RepID=UPI000155A07A|nr:hypothetical protein [Pedobacter sp. BAL39]EDM35120.1 hypothetical protein PBAL39_16601 [Pedobacter sp. BAL39]